MRGVVKRVVAVGVAVRRGATMSSISTHRCYDSSYDSGRFGMIRRSNCLTQTRYGSRNESSSDLYRGGGE